jgi:hypothetical protein
MHDTNRTMEFVELPIFTRRTEGHLTDEDVRALQNVLLERPRAGAVIRGSGGFRKIRVAVAGRGRRGGGRVIYYPVPKRNRIYLLFFFPKNKQADLSPEQLRVLKSLIADEPSAEE